MERRDWIALGCLLAPIYAIALTLGYIGGAFG